MSYNFKVVKGGVLDGITYHNVIHNGHIVYNNTKSMIIAAVSGGHMDDIIADFYAQNPHLNDE